MSGHLESGRACSEGHLEMQERGPLNKTSELKKKVNRPANVESNTWRLSPSIIIVEYDAIWSPYQFSRHSIGVWLFVKNEQKHLL